MASPAGRADTPSKLSPRSAAILPTRRRGRRLRRHEERPLLRPRRQPGHLFPARQQPVDRGERIVDRVAERVAGGRGRRDLAWRRLLQAIQLFERAVESVEDAVDLDAHLIGQRPARAVVRAGRRAARIGNVVGMVLRLEHVEHVGPECLRGLDDVGAGRVVLARHGERGRRAMNRHAGLDERVDELGRRREVGLVGRKDETARVARRGIAQELLEILGRTSAAAATAAAGVGLVTTRRVAAAAAATAAERRPAPQ